MALGCLGWTGGTGARPERLNQVCAGGGDCARALAARKRVGQGYASTHRTRLTRGSDGPTLAGRFFGECPARAFSLDASFPPSRATYPQARPVLNRGRFRWVEVVEGVTRGRKPGRRVYATRSRNTLAIYLSDADAGAKRSTPLSKA